MSSGLPQIKTLSVHDAFLTWLRLYPVTEFELSDKFSGDHTLERLSSSNAAQKAIDRFRKNRNTLSTWMDITKEKIIDKVQGTVHNARHLALNSGTPENALTILRPTVYRGGQQLAACIKCSVRKVTVSEVTRDEAMRGPNKNRHHKVEVGGSTSYVLCKSSETEEKFWIMGGWNPLKCSFELYHYQGHVPTPEIEMLPCYCRWSVETDGTPRAPQAKK